MKSDDKLMSLVSTNLKVFEIFPFGHGLRNECGYIIVIALALFCEYRLRHQFCFWTQQLVREVKTSQRSPSTSQSLQQLRKGIYNHPENTPENNITSLNETKI